jgi:hypothetical protein
VLHMRGIITFESMNVYLVGGVVVAPFDGFRIATVLLSIERPRKEKFLLLLGKSNLHGFVVVVLQNVETLSRVSDQNDLCCEQL